MVLIVVATSGSSLSRESGMRGVRAALIAVLSGRPVSRGEESLRRGPVPLLPEVAEPPRRSWNVHSSVTGF